jgi:hypothetical protein
MKLPGLKLIFARKTSPENDAENNENVAGLMPDRRVDIAFDKYNKKTDCRGAWKGGCTWIARRTKY